LELAIQKDKSGQNVPRLRIQFATSGETDDQRVQAECTEERAIGIENDGILRAAIARSLNGVEILNGFHVAIGRKTGRRDRTGVGITDGRSRNGLPVLEKALNASEPLRVADNDLASRICAQRTGIDGVAHRRGCIPDEGLPGRCRRKSGDAQRPAGIREASG
jgi:hypothetical protein